MARNGETLGEFEHPVHIQFNALPTVRASLQHSQPATLAGSQWLWAVIRNRTRAIGFNNYDRFMTGVMCEGTKDPNRPAPWIDPEITRKQTAIEEEMAALVEKAKSMGGSLTLGRISNRLNPGVVNGKGNPENKKKEIQAIIESIERLGQKYKCLDVDLRAEKQRLQSFDSCLMFHGTDAYEVFKRATELFLMQECGLALNWDTYESRERSEQRRLPQLEGDNDDEREDEIIKSRTEYLEKLQHEAHWVLPYFKHIRENLEGVPLKGPGESPENCYGILRSKLSNPCLLELIWSYWHEAGMLVQSIGAIARRFQNIRRPDGRDPLTHLEIDPLRPLNNFLWGYIQDETHRLSMTRRVYEYDHHYGLRLFGRAVPDIQGADSRSKFLEAFHHLLNLCSVFYKEISDTTVIPDGFPMLNALKETHLLLAQGAHNQFGDLPWTARVEMLMEQWLIARPEMREFLAGRTMVPYPERWMERVDTMKQLQGWTDVTVRHFRDLGVFGEQIILSIRYGDWSNITNEEEARVWAWYWREEIQGYIHAYRAVCGVDLTTIPAQTQINSTQPVLLIMNRMARQPAVR